ncbi:MscS Mechanosensitive ion channel [Haliangium ochraceum DSM 14365]|uniref:MscS Mechanosensitive ion channel n=2 Tax=Haliangium ochraceum TaxID=80816 RepID=D0LZG7_HALO1|nr:MscS Mechanosensitive ion channel [Haliangium ochraceum DSM 14365]
MNDDCHSSRPPHLFGRAYAFALERGGRPRGARGRRGAAIAAAASATLSARAAWAQDGIGAEAGKILEFVRPSGLLLALVAVIAATVTLRFLHSLTERLGARFSDRRLLVQQVSTILRFAVYLVTILFVAGSAIDLEPEAVLALSGVIAVTVGFALKDLASSVLAGITILFDRPFQVGDRVTVAGQYGEISRIGLRSVRLVTLDDSLVTIPNNKFLTEVVVSGNAGALDMQMVFDFYIAVDSDVALAKRIVYEALRTSRFVYLEKPVVVLVRDVIEANYFATRLRAKAYVLDVRYEQLFISDVTERVKQAYRGKGILPPTVIVAPSAQPDAQANASGAGENAPR